ncbi:MAG: CCXG family PEP-CTERM protein [Pseudomonadota bacterium]
MTIVRCFLCAMLAALLAAPAHAWDCMNTHRNRVDVSVDATGHSEEIRIDLSASDFPATYDFSPDGDDVRVVASDDITPIDHAVTGWNGITRTGTIFIRPPALAPNASTSFYVYYGDTDAAGLSDPTTVFPTNGMRLHSRSTPSDPETPAQARAAFEAASDISNAVYSSVTGLNNRAVGGTANDFAWCISALIEVTPATEGLWGFRYGADFGHGGHLFVREQELESQWTDDLWWAGNFANTAETLEGSIYLEPGWHRYEALGFEGCCDGPVGWQAQAPGGPWRDMSSTNFSLRATRCIVSSVSVTIQTPESCSTTPNAIKTATLISDPLGTPAAYALPGSVVEYAIEVTNTGTPPDAGSIVLTDTLPGDVKLIVSGANAFEFTDGTQVSGLTFSWGGPASTADSVSFSRDGVDFTVEPAPAGDLADDTITHVRFSPSGSMNPSVDGTTPSFTVRFRTIVE